MLFFEVNRYPLFINIFCFKVCSSDSFILQWKIIVMMKMREINEKICVEMAEEGISRKYRGQF